MKKMLIGFAVVLMMLSFSLPVMAAPKPSPSVTMGVTGQASTPMGIIPETPGGGNSNNWVYQYTIFDGGSVSDTLPIQVCITGEESDPWVSFKVELKQAGDLPGSLSASELTYTYTQNLPYCQTMNITFDTGVINLADPAVSENFDGNLQISDKDRIVPDGSNNLKVEWNDTANNIKIKILVLPADPTINISCYMTDSGGYFLNNCEGEPVNESGSDEGRFSIVTNNRKGIVVATNPGQFYFNVLYENTTGSSQVVDVRIILPITLNPKGAQAVHAALFPPPFSGVSPTTFNVANEGIPEGTDGSILGITIPSDWTLWVTYHVEYAGLGQSIPIGLATSCGGANETFSVTGSVSGTGISEQCTAGASGYKK